MTVNVLDAPAAASNRRHNHRRIDLSILPFQDQTWPETDPGELQPERRHRVDRRFLGETEAFDRKIRIAHTGLILLLVLGLIVGFSTSLSQNLSNVQRPPEIGSPQAYYQWTGYHRTAVE